MEEIDSETDGENSNSIRQLKEGNHSKRYLCDKCEGYFYSNNIANMFLRKASKRKHSAIHHFGTTTISAKEITKEIMISLL